MDIILCVLLANSLLTLLRAFLDYDKGSDFVYDWKTDPCFLISITNIIIIALLIFVLLLMHKCKWEKEYRYRGTEKVNRFSDGHDAFNKECEKYYNWMGR